MIFFNIVFRLIILTSFILVLTNCAETKKAQLSKPLKLYYENKIDEVINGFKEIISAGNENALTYAWLAQSYLRKGNNYDAKKYSQNAISRDPDNAFAHLVLAKSILPNNADENITQIDSSWVYLQKAAILDSTNPNIWVELWGQSIQKGNFNQWEKSVKKLYDTGFLTRAVLNYGRWMLETIPPNSILITNGDMDTFPPQALQIVESLRTDVIIVERGLLDYVWAIKFLRDNLNLSIPFTDKQLDELNNSSTPGATTNSLSENIFYEWFAEVKNGTLNRPIVFATTVSQDFITRFKSHISYAGPFLRLNSEPVNKYFEMNIFKKSLDGIKDYDFSGPWASEKDLSPIRFIYTKGIIQNITYSALVYSEELLKENKFGEVKEILTWLEELEKKTEIGYVSKNKIDQLRAAAKQQ